MTIPETGAKEMASKRGEMLSPLATVREITDSEVEFYQRNGWVKLDALVDRELAAELLRVGKLKIEQKQSADIWSVELNFALDGIEPFRSLALSETMGQNVHRLVNRDRLTDRVIPIRLTE